MPTSIPTPALELESDAAVPVSTPSDWLAEKVKRSLADPRPNLAHPKVMQEAQSVIEAKRQQHAGKATC